jgi:DNA-directed RNA polymerase specialized sigma24 family protein
MAKRGPKPKKTEYYVDPSIFKQQLVEYYTKGTCLDQLAESLNKIAHGLSYSSNFINYTYREDMVGDALVKMYTAVKNKKFDVTSEYNPFSYFTTIAFHAFINRIKKEKRHNQALDEYKSKFYAEEMSKSSDANIYIKPDSDDDEVNDE